MFLDGSLVQVTSLGQNNIEKKPNNYASFIFLKEMA
jgi:hypothetical protein